MLLHHPTSTLFPYTTLFRSRKAVNKSVFTLTQIVPGAYASVNVDDCAGNKVTLCYRINHFCDVFYFANAVQQVQSRDRKSTRLNSSHRCISYAVFCLKKKKK